MKKKKIIVCTAVLISICTFLCGCTDIGLGSQSVLRPPRATGNEAALQAILNKETGSLYTLKYPQTGAYRAAVNFFDDVDFLSAAQKSGKEQKLNSDQLKKYAVAFYSIDNDSGSQMYISFMERKNDKWKQMGKFPNAGSGVDRIIYDDITGDGKGEFIVGWQSYSSELNNLTVYTIDNGELREMTVDESYSDMLVEDFSDDSVKDIMMISLRTDKTPSSANLLQYDKNSMRPMSSVSAELDSDVVSFQKVAYGSVDGKNYGAVMDCKKEDGNYVTQVLYYSGDKEDGAMAKLVKPLTPEIPGDPDSPDAPAGPSFEDNPTVRKDLITSRDINNDNIIEVPVVRALFSPTDQSFGDVCNLTEWKQADAKTGKLVTKISTVIDYADGYYMAFPEKWNSAVTGFYETESRTLSFYMWNNETLSVGDKLVTIHRFKRSDWEKSEHSGYVALLSEETKDKDYVIAAELFSTAAQDSINISEKELEKNVAML